MFEQKSLEQRRALVIDMFARAAIAYGVGANELAEKLGCEHSIIKQWIFQGEVPIELLLRCRQVTNTTMDWLITGKEHVPLTPEQQEQRLQDYLFDAINEQANRDEVGAGYGKIKALLECKANRDLALQISQIRIARE